MTCDVNDEFSENLSDEIDGGGGEVGEALEEADDAEAHEEHVEGQPVQREARPYRSCNGRRQRVSGQYTCKAFKEGIFLPTRRVQVTKPTTKTRPSRMACTKFPDSPDLKNLFFYSSPPAALVRKVTSSPWPPAKWPQGRGFRSPTGT